MTEYVAALPRPSTVVASPSCPTAFPPNLLDSPNDHVAGVVFKHTMMAHLELTGKFYGLLDSVTNDATPPRAIHPLNPGRVRVKLNKAVFPYLIDH